MNKGGGEEEFDKLDRVVGGLECVDRESLRISTCRLCTFAVLGTRMVRECRIEN